MEKIFRCSSNQWRLRQLCIFCILLAIIIFCIREYQTSFSSAFGQYKPIQNSNLLNGKVIIIIFTSFFDQKLWGSTEEALNREISNCKGKANNCMITYDHSYYQKAGALLFHGRNVERERKYSPSNLIKLRHITKAYNQKWIFLSHETPSKGLGDAKYQAFDNVFNWTMTYNRNSDVFYSYGDFEPIIKYGANNITNKNYAITKTKLVAWQVSNCGPQLRLNYVKELEKLIHVNVSGRCAILFENNAGQCPRNKHNECQKMLSEYKFYLAFENSFCTDYVTEKYWRAIDRESVPIVMGDSDPGSMIPGSFIDVNNFKSIKEFADYLIFLDNNDKEYNQYFDWKNKYHRPYVSLYCKMCQKLNQEKALQEDKGKFSDKFSYGKVCDQKPERKRDLEKQIEKSRKIFKAGNVLRSVQNWYLKTKLKVGIV